MEVVERGLEGLQHSRVKKRPSFTESGHLHKEPRSGAILEPGAGEAAERSFP